MQNEKMNDEAVSPVIATILMVAITVVLAGVLYVWASSLAEGNTDGNLALYQFGAEDANGDTTEGTRSSLLRRFGYGLDCVSPAPSSFERKLHPSFTID